MLIPTGPYEGMHIFSEGKIALKGTIGRNSSAIAFNISFPESFSSASFKFSYIKQ